MVTAAIVPMRHDSERVKGKNYRPLGGRPLYQHIVETLLATPEIDQVVIDTDSPTIVKDAAAAFPEVLVLDRPAHLRAGEIPMNEVLLHTVGQLDADVFLQTHSTNPFVRPATISAALRLFEDTMEADSVFSATRLQARLWSADVQPINHDPSVLLRTQDLPPVYLENSCFYIFTREVLVSRGNRIGITPVIVELEGEEALDIDEERDFRMAQLVWRVLSEEAP